MRMSSFNKFSKLVLVAALSAVGASSQAGEASGALNVSANVQATCVIASVGTMAFGTYVQGLTAPVDATATIDFNCGAGVVYSVRLSGLSGPMRTMAQGTNLLQYQLYRDAARTQMWGQTDNTNTADGVGTGASAPLTVYGRIPDSAANQLAASGAYTSVVTVTVAY